MRNISTVNVSHEDLARQRLAKIRKVSKSLIELVTIVAAILAVVI